MSEWISVKDRLPEPGEKVITFLRLAGSPRMPLPEPPGGETKKPPL